MDSLSKITEISEKYDVTARTLRYYESIGLIKSTREEGYSYRMFTENEVKKIEQILVLRKLNISIKDIQRIFDSVGAEIVLEVLEKKVEMIEEEVSLLKELKEIVLDFISEIENLSFSKGDDVKFLYNKAKDIESQIMQSDYKGKTNNINRLISVTDKLDKKVPDMLVVKIPPFKAITTGDQTWYDMFKDGGLMFQLWQKTDLYKPIIFDCFDFILSKGEKAEWICALKENITTNEIKPFKLKDFKGGLYAMAVSIDEDNESIKRVEEKVKRWIQNTNFDLDTTRDTLVNMPYIYEPGRDIDFLDIERGLGYKQMQRYFPVKLSSTFDK